MKKTILLTMAIAIVAVSLLVYGCSGPTESPPAPINEAPQEAAMTEEPASDLVVNPGVDVSNPADLPVPSEP